MPHWRNWAGNVACRPAKILSPGSEEELAAIVRHAGDEQGTLRVAGSGHSFTPLCRTNGTLLRLDRLQGIAGADPATGEATIWGGMKIAQLGAPLRAAGLAMENQGDVDYQALAGAIATGTHGTGIGFGSLSTTVTRLRLVAPSGEPVTCSASIEPELFKAAQLSLGVLGVITQLSLRLLPAYRLHERTQIVAYEETMSRLDERIRDNEHFEFFWLPQHDVSVIKLLNPTDAEPTGLKPPPPAPPGTLERYTRPERVGWSYEIFPSERTTPFVEMEFAVPLAHGPDCLRELRALLQERHPRVAWAVEYRTQGADDLYLSPAYQRDSATISIHESPHNEYRPFFADAEAIFRNHRGRPHWAKLHSHSARQLRSLYPMWGQFQAQRRRLDPHGMLLNPYLRRLFQDD